MSTAPVNEFSNSCFAIKNTPPRTELVIKWSVMWVGRHSASSVRVASPPQGRNLRKVGPAVTAEISPHCNQCKQQCDQCCKCCSAICTECLLQNDKKNPVDGITGSNGISNGDTYICECPKDEQVNGKKPGKEKSRLKCCF